ncbi:Cysteine protease atg4 [Coemansia sp. RSA 2711]|nr:Cysteine protease atg4 [Coemansia sp. RSA 2711]
MTQASDSRDSELAASLSPEASAAEGSSTCPPSADAQLPKANEGTADLAVLRTQVVNALRDWYVMALDSIASLLDGRFLQQPPKDLWLLGRHYDIEVQPGEQGWAGGYPPDVIDDFGRLIWCTYRSQYPAIAQSDFTTDAGWGCMLRAGQTLMAQALQLHHFGRDWGFSWDSALDEHVRRRQLYVGIVEQFLDDYTPSSTFSIQRMAAMGRQFEGKDIGEWFGPYGTARILRGLAHQASHEVSVYTTTDGVVYLADVCEAEFKPTLILVASMLGIDRVNPVYYPFIQASLMLPQSAGIAGGRPSSALYFAGFQGDELLYLDPHYTRPAVARRENSSYSQADLATYSCANPRRIALSRLDPCMVFGYYCATLESLVDLRSRVELLADDGVKVIMTFDNGHAPEMALPSETPASGVDTANTEDGQQALVTRLPETPSSGTSTSSSRSTSGEIVLEADCSEEEWVTEL